MEQSVPKHINLYFRNQTLYWSGSDQQAVWKKHMTDASISKYLKSAGWDNEKAIEYKFNSHGFRDDELDQRDNCLAVGCSFTEGVGLRKDQIWPSKLTKLIGTHVWNLGIGGASADTCFRITDYYIKTLNPKAVFLLTPPPMRVELHADNEVRSYLPTDTGISSFVKKWFACDDNGTINRYKNILAMKQLCIDSKIKFYVRDSIGTISKEIDVAKNPARDLIHYGEEVQEYFAKEFYKDYINGNSKRYRQRTC